MGESDIARIFKHGRSQVVRLPLAFRLPGDRVRVRRVEGGILLEPIVTDLDEWFRELDRFADIPFMEDGRRQPPMPAGGSARLTYLLDTNAVIALLRTQAARGAARRAVSEDASIMGHAIVSLARTASQSWSERWPVTWWAAVRGRVTRKLRKSEGSRKPAVAQSTSA